MKSVWIAATNTASHAMTTESECGTANADGAAKKALYVRQGIFATLNGNLDLYRASCINTLTRMATVLVKSSQGESSSAVASRVR